MQWQKGELPLNDASWNFLFAEIYIFGILHCDRKIKNVDNRN